MSEVFVSYKRENLAAVGRLVEALRAEGIGVWWDQDIAPNAPPNFFLATPPTDAPYWEWRQIAV